jgi:hypothetical protein
MTGTVRDAAEIEVVPNDNAKPSKGFVKIKIPIIAAMYRV